MVLTVEMPLVECDLVIVTSQSDSISWKFANNQPTEELILVDITGGMVSAIPASLSCLTCLIVFTASKVVPPFVLGNPEVVRGNLKSGSLGFGSTLMNPVFFASPKNLWHIDVQGLVVGLDQVLQGVSFQEIL